MRESWSSNLAHPRTLAGGTLLALLLIGQYLPGADSSTDPVDFNRDIRPILASTCLKCHGGVKRESGLSLLFRADALATTRRSGRAAIVPGKPGESELIHRVTADDPDDRMPPAGKPLSSLQIDLLRRWITAGAPYDDHWAFKRPRETPLPRVKNRGWVRSGIDHFILAALEEKGLEPSPEADRYTLIRRLSLDLTGLPPPLEEVEAFVRDASVDAYASLVERLLGSQHYGERWARLWLDLARYADTQGYEKDNRRTIWRYRDWVIAAFNRDLPFDQFTIDQFAGDLLPGSGQDQLIATAFHRNTMTNTEGGTDDEEFRMAAVMDRVNTTWQVWMGTTFGCNQCHNHPYDPFTQKEYYQFLAFLNNTEDSDKNDEQPTISTPTREQEKELERLRGEIAVAREPLDTPTRELEAAQAAWENSLRGATEWNVLRPQSVESSEGTTLTVLEDGSVLASGANPSNDTYSFRISSPISHPTAFRLEVMPDESLPQMGPGRTLKGNFVLSRFRVTLSPREYTPIRGRFVRIQLPGKKRILSLAEVEVSSGGRNVAPGGEARQSSTTQGGVAGLAIDGNTDGDDRKAKSTTHTETEDDPWWEVDLGAESEINAITIWNRTDGKLQSRLDRVHVSVLGKDRKTLWQTSVERAPKKNLKIPLAGPQLVPLVSASADFSAKSYPVEHALLGPNPTKNGWSVSPHVGRAHRAIFISDRPLEAGGGAQLEFRLEHLSSRRQSNIGRFRLAVTGDTGMSRRYRLPDGILAIIDRAPADRAEKKREELAAYFRSIVPSLEVARRSVDQLEKKLAKIKPPTTPVLRELPAQKRRSTHILTRGNFLAPTEEVEEGVPANMQPLPEGAVRNRLSLARWLVDPHNPLTARVQVNRFWEQLFGKGLVETSEDFGTQGALPSHPELLDWLALEFMHRHAWSQKSVLRELVMSATYRQSSRVSEELLLLDPENRLIARGPRFRLAAETIRDQALASSGLLTRKLFGPSVMPPQPDRVWQVIFSGDKWITEKGPERYRRGLYTFWRRTSPYPSLITFDAVSREVCVVRRVRTNTPLQALVVLNDPAYVEASQALARRIMTEAGPDPRDRVAHGFRLCLLRPPRKAEVDRLLELYLGELEHYRENREAAVKLATEPLGPAPGGVDISELASLTVVSNVLLNLDEYLTKG